MFYHLHQKLFHFKTEECGVILQRTATMTFLQFLNLKVSILQFTMVLIHSHMLLVCWNSLNLNRVHVYMFQLENMTLTFFLSQHEIPKKVQLLLQCNRKAESCCAWFYTLVTVKELLIEKTKQSGHGGGVIIIVMIWTSALSGSTMNFSVDQAYNSSPKTRNIRSVMFLIPLPLFWLPSPPLSYPPFVFLSRPTLSLCSVPSTQRCSSTTSGLSGGFGSASVMPWLLLRPDSGCTRLSLMAKRWDSSLLR